MHLSEESLSKSAAAKTSAAALAAALLSVVFVRAGFLGIFFLLPFVLAGFFAGGKALWLAGFFGILGNAASLFAFWKTAGAALPALQWNAVFYTVMTLVFCWINGEPEKESLFPGMVSALTPGFACGGKYAVYRLALGSLAVSAMTLPFLSANLDNADFSRFFAEQLGTPESVDAQAILLAFKYIGVRGGILASILFFFAVTRQTAVLIVWLVKRERNGGSLAAFHAAPFLIWVLSFSLGAVLLGKAAGIEMLEIGAWNILVLCATLYLAQGGGIALYLLVKLPPVLRILVNLGVLLILFRPGINVIIPGILIVAGIIENWIPFRVSSSQGPPPTPEA